MPTIAELKKQMTDIWIKQPAIKSKYALQDDKTFEKQFSPVSIESIFFYTVASFYWTLYNLFELFRIEIDKKLANQKVHSPLWYRNKTLLFQKDYVLPPDSDVYNMIDTEAMVVKYAAAVETADSSKLLIKIAGGSPGNRQPLPDEVARQVYQYLLRIKDPIRIELINQSPDYYTCIVDIYYDGMLLADRVQDAVRTSITGYLENLDFNGEYSNMALVDVLQKVEGVVIPELIESRSKPSAGNYALNLIEAKLIPVAGYLRAYNANDIIINMKPYELV